jgi:hypothetical protein
VARRPGRLPLAVALACALAAGGCSLSERNGAGGGGGGRATGPVTTRAKVPGTGVAVGRGSRVEVRRGAFAPSEGSGVVASSSYPGVVWAIRDGGRSEPGRPRAALYAYRLAGGKLAELAPGRKLRAIPVPGTSNLDWEDIARDDQGNLWIGDIGDNACQRRSITLYKVREPNPATAASARLLAAYRLRYPDHDPGCRGWDAESLFLVEDVPYLITKSAFPVVYQAGRLVPGGTAALRRIGGLESGGTEPVVFPTGADLSADHRRLAVATYATLAVYQSSDPGSAALSGEALVAHLIRHPARWTVPLGCLLCSADQLSMVEGVAFADAGHDLTLLSERHDVWLVPARAYEH